MSSRREASRLPKELQLAAVAAVLLVLSFVLPWYQKSVVVNKETLVKSNVSGLGAFSFVEAAILLIAVAVVFLVWSRSVKKAFHLPGGDGAVIVLAGGWAILLFVYRWFDKPTIEGEGVGATIGLQWGLFAAMVAAGLLIAAGLRVKQLDAPEPPNPAADDSGWVAVPRRERTEHLPDRRPRDATAVTEMLRERPSWEGDIADAPTTRLDDAPTTRLPEDPSEAPTRRERRTEATERLWDDDAPR